MEKNSSPPDLDVIHSARSSLLSHADIEELSSGLRSSFEKFGRRLGLEARMSTRLIETPADSTLIEELKAFEDQVSEPMKPFFRIIKPGEQGDQKPSEGRMKERAESRRALLEVTNLFGRTDLEDLRFSISHSTGFALAAGVKRIAGAAETEGKVRGFGIDLEHSERTLNERVAQRVIDRVIHEEERSLGLSFLDFWVVKEACYKANPFSSDNEAASGDTPNLPWHNRVDRFDSKTLSGEASSGRDPIRFQFEIVRVAGWERCSGSGFPGLATRRDTLSVMAHFHRDEMNQNRAASKLALRSALILTSGFMVIEWLGGYFSNSLALMSDAAHMLTDSAALGLSWFAIWLAERPKSPSMSFGYQRAEILGALASGLMVWGLTAVLVYEAVMRIGNPPEVKGSFVAVVAVIGMAINIAVMLRLHRAQKKSMNVRAAFIHVLGDLLGSIGALVSGLLIWQKGWYLADPIATFLIAAILFYSSWKLVREAVEVLMEATPKGVNPKGVDQDLRAIPEVTDVHDLHIWTVAEGHNALSVHLISKNSEGVLSQAHSLLTNNHGIHHTTIQIEHPDRFDRSRCIDCN